VAATTRSFTSSFPVEFDSATLARAASIAHRMLKPGRWRLEVRNVAGRILARTFFRVADGAPVAAAVNIGAADGQPNEVALRPGGYLSLNSSLRRDPVFALLFAEEGEETVWDSRRLEPGDGFACLPMRPGRYRLANKLNDTESGLTIAYPDPRATAAGRRLAVGPVRVRAGERIEPAQLVLDPGQPLVVDVAVAARIVLTLEAPDDGPPDLAEWKARRNEEALAAVFERRTPPGG
jgi:hypothetical protein